MQIIKLSLIALLMASNTLPCPFTFVNDSRKIIILLDQATQAKTLIYQGQTKFIPGAEDVPNNYIWVYVQDQINSTKFTVKYGITEYECEEAGKPVPQLKFSQFAARAMANDRHKGFGIINYDKYKFPNVNLTIQNESVNTLVEKSIVETANLVLKNKKTLAQLKKQLPSELYERLEQYVKAKDI